MAFKKSPNFVQHDHYQELTDRIVAALEAGVKPWVRGWDPAKSAQAPGSMYPMNPTTRQFYRGINVLLLGMSPLAMVSGDPRWCSYKQAAARGWQVRGGEKGTTIFFFRKLTVEDETAKDGTKSIPMLRTSSVFHVSQMDGVPAYARPTHAEAPWTKSDAAAVILAASGAVIHVGGPVAQYIPSLDVIQMPTEAAFKDGTEWASTSMHELGHWTGHKSRLDRDLSVKFGSDSYAQEELRAELGTVFVCSMLGLPVDVLNRTSYIATWLRTLKNDKREIFRAAADAQRIADMVLGFHPDFAARMTADAADRAEQDAERADEVKLAA